MDEEKVIDPEVLPPDPRESAFKPIEGILAKPPTVGDIVNSIEKTRATALVAFDEDIKELKKKKKLNVACKKMCNLCCYTLVPITYGEDALLLSTIIGEDFNVVTSMVGLLNDAYENAGVYKLWDEGKLKEAAIVAFGLHMSCPFLNHETKLCIAYKRRPIVCFSKAAGKISQGRGKSLNGRELCKDQIRKSNGLMSHLMPTRVIRCAEDIEVRERMKSLFQPLPRLVNRTVTKLAPLTDDEKLLALGMEVKNDSR